MKEDQLLREFYDTQYKCIYDPEFDESDDRIKQALSLTMAFAVFKFSKAFHEIGKALIKPFL